jgi:putative membrane protein
MIVAIKYTSYNKHVSIKTQVFQRHGRKFIKGGRKMNTQKAKDKRKVLLIILSVSIVAVMLVPMLYSTIYLGSIWDVYGKVDNVPVAFVNLDKTVTKDGKEFAVGRQLESNLKDNNKVAWKFVSHEAAMKGVEGKDYYAVIEIPEDFSKNIADAQDGNFKIPEIIYISNKGRNFVFSQISSKVAEGIKTEVGSSISKELSKALVDSLYDVKVSLKDASEAAGELQVGTQKLFDGSKDLAEGAKSAASGSMQLEKGLVTAADASEKLQAGTQKLVNGSEDLSKGLTNAEEGSKQLQAGLKNIADGQNQIIDGSVSLLNGLNNMKSSLSKPNNQVSQLVKGASDIASNADAMAKGAGQLDASFSAMAQAVKSADDYMHNANLSDSAKLNAAMAILDQISRQPAGPKGESQLVLASSSMHGLSLGLQQLNSGSKQVSDGVSSMSKELAATQTSAAAGLDQLINGAKALQKGSSSVLEGLNTVAVKTGEMSSGLNQLKEGSSALKEGLTAVNSGNTDLKEGLYTAAAKTGELSKGLSSLSEGASSLKDGLKEADEGALKLRDGLRDGYVQMDDKLKFDSESMSQFVSEPVAISDKSINDVKNYGEGLAPYFISLSLWIGTMFMSAIFSIAKGQKVFKRRFMNSFLGRYSAGAVLVTLQALILSFTFIKVLGASPNSTAGFYADNVFIAITFFSVMYGVSNIIGIMNAPVMFIVLLLQLASSGGTFPIETAPAFYRIINRVVPMTYSVSNLRMSLSGINSTLFNHNNLIMLIFIMTFMAGGAIVRALIDLTRSNKQAAESSQAV